MSAGAALCAGKISESATRVATTHRVSVRGARKRGRARRERCSQSSTPMISGSSMCMKKTTKKSSELTLSLVMNERDSGSLKIGSTSSACAVPTATSCARSSQTSQ